MSHFLVMVIGDDIEKQLRPFHEFECTGTDDEFVQEVDETAEALKDYAEHGNGRPVAEFVKEWNGREVLAPAEAPNLAGDHKYGYAIADESGGVAKVVRRTNPNSKWDWWVLGGRYSGRLRLKAGAVGIEGEPGSFGNSTGIDQARKGDIDLAAIRSEAAEDAANEYDAFARATNGIDWPEPWPSVRERIKDIDEARDFYHSQPMIVAMRKAKIHFSGPEDFGKDRQAYIDAAVKRAGVPFAFLKDGQWIERGNMGWWAVVSNEKDPSVWQDEFWKMFDALPDDTLISMVDCHT